MQQIITNYNRLQNVPPLQESNSEFQSPYNSLLKLRSGFSFSVTAGIQTTFQAMQGA